MTDTKQALAAVEPVVTREHRLAAWSHYDCIDMPPASDSWCGRWIETGATPGAADALLKSEIKLALLLATVEQNARPTSPPVYPEMVNGQNVKQPTPSILVEIAPSGFAERITYGQVQWDSSRVVKYVLAPPELPSPPPTGASDG